MTGYTAFTGKLTSMSPRTMRSKAASIRAKEIIAEADKPVQGILLYIAYCFFRTLSYCFVQLLYEHVVGLDPFPMMFMRSIFGIGIMMIAMNVNLKKEIWDPCSRDTSGPLIFKTFCGTTKDFINFSVTKFLPLTIITIISNMTGLVVYILAFFFLKETVRKFDLFFMLFLLAGVIACVLGASEESATTGEESFFPLFVLYIFLIINLFLSAGGTIAMRKMKKFPANVVSWYQQIATLVTSVIMMGILNKSFAIYSTFDWIAWLWLFLAAFTNVYGETFRFMALKKTKATTLQVFYPSNVLFQFIFDETVFEVEYTMIQLGALGYLGLLYVFQGLKFVFYDRKRRSKKAQDKMQEKLQASAGSDEMPDMQEYVDSPKSINRVIEDKDDKDDNDKLIVRVSREDMAQKFRSVV